MLPTVARASTDLAVRSFTSDFYEPHLKEFSIVDKYASRTQQTDSRTVYLGTTKLRARESTKKLSTLTQVDKIRRTRVMLVVGWTCF
jgi:hypothetical protein